MHSIEAVVFLDDAQHVEAADAGQADVEQDQVDVLALEERQRRLAARHRQDAVVALEDRGQRIAHPLIVVADQDGLGGPGHGRVGEADCSAFFQLASRSPLSPCGLRL